MSGGARPCLAQALLLLQLSLECSTVLTCLQGTAPSEAPWKWGPRVSIICNVACCAGMCFADGTVLYLQVVYQF